MSNVVAKLPIDEMRCARIGIKVRSEEFERHPDVENAKCVIRIVQKWNHCLKALGVPNDVRGVWMDIDADCSDFFVDDPEDFYPRWADNIIRCLRKCEVRHLKRISKT